MKPYRIIFDGREHWFRHLGEATRFCEAIFDRFGVILAIEEHERPVLVES